MRKLTLAAATIVLALAIAAPAAAGGGGHGGYGGCPGFAEGTEIEMRDSCFSGVAHFAPADGTVTVVNRGSMQHSYTAVDGSFDTGLVRSGESFDLVVGQPGLVKVFCTLHGTASGDGMAGVLVVGDPAATAAAPVAPAPVAPASDSAGTAELVAALDRQSAAITELTAQEAALLGRLVTADGGSSEWPAPLTVVLLLAALAVVGIVAATRAPGQRSITPMVGRPEEA